MIKRFFLSDRNMMMAIFLNTIIIFCLYFPSFKQHDLLVNIDHFFVFLFLIEAIVKLIVLKPRNYFSSNWNRFDFLLVVLSVPSLLLAFFPIPDTSSILIFRVFRLARLFRLMRFVPNIDNILAGLARALRASVFVLMVLVLLNLFFAILACHFYQDVSPEHFGNPIISAYTIFQLFTVEGWNEVADTIANNTADELHSGLARFFFMIVVLIGGIFGMSLANAVFVDEMTMDNNKVLEEKMADMQEDLQQIRALLEKERSS